MWAEKSLPEWHDRPKLPFANSKEFVKKENFTGANKIEDISIEWSTVENKVAAKIYLKTKLIGILVADNKPGWAYMARKEGPLAKVLDFEKWT